MRDQDDNQTEQLKRRPEYINARWLMDNELENPTMAEFSRRIDRKPQQVNRFLNNSPVIGMGRMVREIIEEAFDKPRGWLTMIHPHTQKALATMGIHVKLSGPRLGPIGPNVDRSTLADDATEVSLQEINTALRKLQGPFCKARLSAGLPYDAVDNMDVPLLFSHIGRGRFYTLRTADGVYVATCQRLYGVDSEAGIQFAHGGAMLDEACAMIDVKTLFNHDIAHIVQVCIVDRDGIESQALFCVKDFNEYDELLNLVSTLPLDKVDDFKLI